MQEVIVVIPIYNPLLNEKERISLRQTYEVLQQHPMVVVHPEGMDLEPLQQQFPRLTFQAFPPDYFRDIVGYNRLMLATEFYEAFIDYRYLLIAQLDTYIFNDQLLDWCKRGYDYVGAPWLRRPVYNLPIVRQVISLISWVAHLRGRRTQFDRYGKVGNGGLSLRKIESHLRILRTQASDVADYAITHNREHLYNEDTFWAMEPQDFSYPSWEEAMLFSYNKYPELSYRLTHHQLPFGCHGWTKPKYNKFWKKYILDS